MIKKVNRRKMNESYGVYDLINYFDVWGNEEDGWDVNDVSIDETDIYIDDDASDEEIVDYLIDKVGFLSPSARGKVEVWSDGGMIEFSVAETGEPLGRLERKRTVNGKSFGESKKRGKIVKESGHTLRFKNQSASDACMNVYRNVKTARDMLDGSNYDFAITATRLLNDALLDIEDLCRELEYYS